VIGAGGGSLFNFCVLVLLAQSLCSVLLAAAARAGASMACRALVRPDGRKEPLHAYRRDAPGLWRAVFC